MSERIEEIRERLGKATPGPWYWRNTNLDIYLIGHDLKAVMTFARMGMQGAQPEFRVGMQMEPSRGRNLYDFPDAAFIANAPADVAFLLAEVERLEREKAQALEAGYGKGYSDSVWEQGHNPVETNPYRTAK